MKLLESTKLAGKYCFVFCFCKILRVWNNGLKIMALLLCITQNGKTCAFHAMHWIFRDNTFPIFLHFGLIAENYEDRKCVRKYLTFIRCLQFLGKCRARKLKLTSFVWKHMHWKCILFRALLIEILSKAFAFFAH